MSQDIELKSVTEAMKELRSAFETAAVEDKKSYEEKLSALGGEIRSKVEKATAALDAHEEKNQKMVLEIQEAKNKEVELTERLANLETSFAKKSVGNVEEYKESNEYKAFSDLVQKGSYSDVKAEYKDYLRTDVGQFGGFLVPETLAESLLKQITEVSNVRGLARVRTTQTKTLNIPIRTSLPTASFEGEAESAATSTPKYISETMTAHRQHVIVPVTRDQLNFSNFNMESEVASDAITAFSKSEGNKFILGTGVKQPQGILDSSSGVTSVDTAASGVLSMDDIILLSGEMKSGYNPVYAFNRRTLAALRVEKDGNNQYLWRLGGETMPTQINGFNYVVMEDVPDIAIGSQPVIFGDFFQGYNILDALGMELVRDDVTRKEQAIVEFSWNRYIDGRVVLAEAFKTLTVKA